MDTTTSMMPSVPAPTPDAPAPTTCRLGVNKLTLVTLVIAVAGFAGTAFAGTAPDCSIQALAAVTTAG